MHGRSWIALPAVALALLCPAVLAQEEPAPLAASLPVDKTIVYAELDAQDAFQQAAELLVWIDAEAAGKMTYEVGNLYELIMELAAQQEFHPRLFDDPLACKYYFVLMKMDEPIVETTTYRVPKWDRETWEPIPGEFEERTQTTRIEYAPSFIIRAPDAAIAAEFLEQARALIDREAERDPGEEGIGRREIEVEQGELVGEPVGHSTVGRLGGDIIISEVNPKELWAGLMAPPDDALSKADLYGRFAASERPLQARVLVNLGALVQKQQEDLERGLEEARAEFEAHAGEEPEVPWESPQFQLQVAEASYQAWRTAWDLLSFGKMRQVGSASSIGRAGDAAVMETSIILSHDEPLSALTEELLGGSGRFDPPVFGQSDTVQILGRVSLRRCFDEVIAALRASLPQEMMEFDTAMQMMKAQIGADLPELLALFASDFYLYVDVARREVEETRWEYDEETEDFTQHTETTEKVLPEVTILWGLADPRAAGEMLTTLFTRLSTQPGASGFVRKRTYQETDVYCFGMGVAEEETYPDGVNSWAVVILDRYLTAGSWERVTDVIRQMGAGRAEVPGAVRQAVQDHPDANLLVLMPQAFWAKLVDLLELDEGEGGGIYDALLESIQESEFGTEDEELARRIRESLGEIVRTWQSVEQKWTELAPEWTVISGEHEPGFYEVRWSAEATK